jgi:pilus assembly protein CpaE
MPIRILVAEDEKIIQKIVEKLIIKQGHEPIITSDGQEALDCVEEVRPDLILLDVMMPKVDGYEVCRQLKSNVKTAHIPVIMFTALDSLEQKLKGFEAGADDYIPKSFHPDELFARINVLLRATEAASGLAQHEDDQDECVSEGKIISVFSMRGGVGVTSVAINLAVAMAQLWGENSFTILSDLVLQAGQNALMLNLPLRNTWANIANTPIEDIDADLICAIIRGHDSGVRVMAAPAKPVEAEMITSEKILHTLEIFRGRCGHVVIDLPHDFSDITLSALEASDEILMVVAPELASVRATSMAFEVFETLGYPREKFRLLLNWTFESGGLPRKDIENVLGQRIDSIIPYASEQFIRGVNYGIPPVFEYPESPLGALFEDLAMMFSKEDFQTSEPVNPTESWKRVQKRMERRKSD